MKTTKFTTKIISATEGYYLTDKADDTPIVSRVIAKTIALGRNDSEDNYIEISAEKAEEYKAEKQMAVEEMFAKELANAE